MAVATILNSTDWDPSVSNKMGVCFPKPLRRDMGRNGPGAYLLLSVLGSMTQYRGRQQGLMLDPGTLEPLVRAV